MVMKSESDVVIMAECHSMQLLCVAFIQLLCVAYIQLLCVVYIQLLCVAYIQFFSVWPTFR